MDVDKQINTGNPIASCGYLISDVQAELLMYWSIWYLLPPVFIFTQCIGITYHNEESFGTSDCHIESL